MFIDHEIFDDGTEIEQHRTDERGAILWSFTNGDYKLQLLVNDEMGYRLTTKGYCRRSKDLAFLERLRDRWMELGSTIDRWAEKTI